MKNCPGNGEPQPRKKGRAPRQCVLLLDSSALQTKVMGSPNSDDSRYFNPFPQNVTTTPYHPELSYLHNITISANGLQKDIEDLIHEVVYDRPYAEPTTTDERLSPVCPLSAVPISCPCRGENCNHRQCFDLRQVLTLQVESNWKCPICGSNINYQSLRFDPDFFNLLEQKSYTYYQEPIPLMDFDSLMIND